MTDLIQYSELTPTAIRRVHLLTNNGCPTIFARKVGRGYQVESEALDGHTWSIIELPDSHPPESSAPPVFPENDTPLTSDPKTLDPETPDPEPPDTPKPYIYIPLDMIDPNPYQPRQRMDPEATESLARGLRLKRKTLPDSHGLLQVPLARLHVGRFQLAFGHRRKAAFDRNNKNHAPLDYLPQAEQVAVNDGQPVADVFDWSTMPLILIEATDEEMYDYAARENSDRVDLDPIEKATAIKQAQAEFGWPLSQAANAHGLSKSAGSNLTRLLQLNEEIKYRISTGELGQRHARALLKLSHPDLRRGKATDLALRAIERGLTVAEVESNVTGILGQHQRTISLKKKLADLTCHNCKNQTIQPDPDGYGEAITCITCHKKWQAIHTYEYEVSKRTPGGTLYCNGCGHAQAVSKYVIERDWEHIKCDRCLFDAVKMYWLAEPLDKAETLACPKCNHEINIDTAERDDGAIECNGCSQRYLHYADLKECIDQQTHRVKMRQEQDERASLQTTPSDPDNSDYPDENDTLWDDDEPCYKCNATVETTPTSEQTARSKQIYCAGCGSTWPSLEDYYTKKTAYLDFAAQAQMNLSNPQSPNPQSPQPPSQTDPLPPDILDLVRVLAKHITAVENARQNIIATSQTEEEKNYILALIPKPTNQIMPALRIIGGQPHTNTNALAGLHWLTQTESG